MNIERLKELKEKMIGIYERSLIFTYQFKHYKEINACQDCPCWDTESGCYWGYSYGKHLNDCPLVAIPKTETTNCEWCEIASACEYEVTFFKDDDRWATERSLLPIYCPNCGRKIKED